ncbi:hypothetical protein [Cupriavidus campinensis]|uniref:hypothetical protein n=1 Tax=Cupriavidus campinensis TaxID=151783 RepID=UPI0011EC014C|nr:hypothetical protein [Cupriavidus campinensis]
MRFLCAKFALMASLGLAACAPMIPASPAHLVLSQPSTATNRIQFQFEVPIKLDTGYTRTLRDKSIWSRIGQVPQGDVYHPVGTIFTIEGRQVHEAYLVVKDRQLVGFYLPGEEHYSPLSTAVPLTFGEVE